MTSEIHPERGKGDWLRRLDQPTKSHRQGHRESGGEVARQVRESAGKSRSKAPGKKPATAVAVKKSKSDTVTKPKKDGKPKKVKMVRDSYTMPENDYAKLAELKKTCLKAGVHVKKSELLRAGLTTLAKLPTATLLKTVERLEKIKTGRPGKH